MTENKKENVLDIYFCNENFIKVIKSSFLVLFLILFLFIFFRLCFAKNIHKESELFSLYERFKFNINQLLTVEESHKLLSGPESRAIIYQGILITKDTPERIKLIKLLKDSFQADEITNAFDIKLVKFLKEIDEALIPPNYTTFYNTYKKSDISKNKKIKFNNKIIHQSKILDYFKEDSDLKNVEKDLENILKKIKKDKKYFFSTKDLIMLCLEDCGSYPPLNLKNLKKELILRTCLEKRLEKT